MLSNRRKLAAILGVPLLTLGGWAFTRHHGGTPYQTAPLERGDLTGSISATGTLNAVVTVQVGSQVSGNIKELYADFNSHVQQGQLVARIDPEVFESRVNQARASLDSARASVANVEALLAKTRADAASARAARDLQNAQVARARVALKDAQSKLDRRKEMMSQGVLSREDLDTAQATFDASKAEVAAMESQLAAAESASKAAEAQIRLVESQVQSAKAQVRQSEAALKQAELDLRHTEIRAPVDGTVIARQMDVGQTVAASFQAPTIFQIAKDLRQMQVDANVDEADVGRVRLGQPASFTVDAFPGRVFRGSISQIRKAPLNVQNVVTYDVIIGVDNSDLKLFPGMTANVKIITDQATGVLKAPNAALRFRPMDERATKTNARSPAVYVLNDRNKVVRIPVEAGISDGRYTEVRSPQLHEGEQVVVGAMVAENGSAGAKGRGPTRRGPGF